MQPAFDSSREPVPTGHRGGLSGDRHLVYQSREYALDVRLPPDGNEPGILCGEPLSRSDGPMARIPAFLLAGDEITGYDRTGALGEVHLPTGGATDLRLCLLLDAERCINLPIAIARSGAEAGNRRG